MRTGVYVSIHLIFLENFQRGMVNSHLSVVSPSSIGDPCGVASSHWTVVSLGPTEAALSGGRLSMASRLARSNQGLLMWGGEL